MSISLITSAESILRFFSGIFIKRHIEVKLPMSLANGKQTLFSRDRPLLRLAALKRQPLTPLAIRWLNHKFYLEQLNEFSSHRFSLLHMCPQLMAETASQHSCILRWIFYLKFGSFIQPWLFVSYCRSSRPFGSTPQERWYNCKDNSQGPIALPV